MICQGRLVGPLLLVLLLSACGKKNQGWESFPVPIYTQSSMMATPNAIADFNDAMIFWETKAGRKLFDYKGEWSNPRTPYSGDITNPTAILGNVFFFENPWPFGRNVVGETTTHSEDQKIIGAIVMINPATLFCERDCTGQGNYTSQRKTFTHELGHFLGLNHAASTNNIMFPNSIPGASLVSVEVDEVALKVLTEGRD